MRLPIDTTVVKFAAAGPAESFLDFETCQAKTNEHGVPLFSIPVFVMPSGIGGGLLNNHGVYEAEDPVDFRSMNFGTLSERLGGRGLSLQGAVRSYG